MQYACQYLMQTAFSEHGIGRRETSAHSFIKTAGDGNFTDRAKESSQVHDERTNEDSFVQLRPWVHQDKHQLDHVLPSKLRLTDHQVSR